MRPIRKNDFIQPLKAKTVVLALILAVLLSCLAKAVVFSDFRRVNLEGTVGGNADSGFTGRLVIGPNVLDRGGAWLLFLGIRAEGPQRGTASVFINATPIGGVPFGARDLDETSLAVPDGLLHPGVNSVDIQAGDQGWRVTGIRLKNYSGYSRGVFKMIVIPEASRDYQGISWIAAAGLLGVLFILGICRGVVPASPWIDRGSAFFLILFVGVSAAAAALPFVTKWRLLFSVGSLISFIFFSHLSVAAALLKFIFLGIKRNKSFLQSCFTAQGLDASSRKKLVVSLVLPAVICLFFFSYMSGIRKHFDGNYSRFLRIEEERLRLFDRLYLPSFTGLLFENSDFETGTLRNWTPEGNAFLYQPVRQEDLDRNHRRFYLNPQGLYWVGTYDKNGGASQGDRPFGKLISVDFVVRYDKIRFLIGGGRSDGARGLGESVALEVGGKVVLEETGSNDDLLRTREWDVRPWLGRTARILITDDPSPETHFRHVNADWFHFYQANELLKTIAPLENYDGQFNFFMAFDPFLSKYKSAPRTYRLIVDEPAYRFGRIGFPLLIKLFSLDNPVDYPKTIIGLIVASHFFGAFFLLQIILVFKKSPLWTFLYLLVPGFYYSLNLGLPESISMAFLLAGLFCYLRERVLGTAVLLAASFFFRETGFLVAAALMGIEVFQKRNFRRALLIGSCAGPYFLWRIFLTIRLFEVTGWKTLFFSPGDFTVPFLGLKDLLTEIAKGGYFRLVVPTAIAYAILLTLVFILSLIFFFKHKNIFSLGLILFSLVSVSLEYKMIWVGMENGIRGTYEVFIFLILAFLYRKEDWTPRLKYAVFGLWAGVFIFQFMIMNLSNFFRTALFFW